MAPRRAPRCLALVLLALATAGCSSAEVWAVFEHHVVVDEDTIGDGPALECPRPGPPRPLLLEVAGHDPSDRLLLQAVVAAIDSHSGLDVRGVALEGADASVREGRGGAAGAARVLLSCTHEQEGRLLNAVVAFPGMVVFAPIWLGYTWEVEATFSIRVVGPDGAAAPPVVRVVRVRFREKNSVRSAAFHLWPSTGFFGTQFLLGLVMMPLMCFYEGPATTEVLLRAIGPRLGRVLADVVYREVGRRAGLPAGG